MTSIDEGWETYYRNTAQISTITRQMALAGVAVIWAFKTDTPSLVPGELALGAVVFMLALLFDLLQYVWMAISWQRRTRKAELRRAEKLKAREDNADLVENYEQHNKVPNRFFWAKVVTTVVAWVIVLWSLYGRISS